MFNRQNSNLLSHYDISISNIYFNHLWLMFKKASQFFLPTGDCGETDRYQVSVARGSEVKKLEV